MSGEFFAHFRCASAPLRILACTLMPGEATTRRRTSPRRSNTSEDTAMADKAQTWVYTEDYVAESEALTSARAVATEMGASPVSPGTGAALRVRARS